VSAPAFALLGAGEFETWHDDIDRALLDGSNGDGTVLISPAASAPEGEAVFGTWAAKGLAHYERLGIRHPHLVFGPAKLHDVSERNGFHR
jgi:hypothetical protein